jgi:hypothetical protein
MIRFEYKDISVEFQNWNDAASWFCYQLENDNPRIRHIIDSSMYYFGDFTAWVNDNYTAYDILSRCHNDLYDDLKSRYIQELADDLENGLYDFCQYFTDSNREYPKPMPDMKYFKITYSCGCGENEEYIEAHNLDEAWHAAHEAAVEDYQSYEGLYGIRSFDDIAEELFGDDEGFDYLTDKQLAEVDAEYEEAIENEINYSAEEITFEEYLKGKGE